MDVDIEYPTRNLYVLYIQKHVIWRAIKELWNGKFEVNMWGSLARKTRAFFQTRDTKPNKYCVMEENEKRDQLGEKVWVYKEIRGVVFEGIGTPYLNRNVEEQRNSKLFWVYWYKTRNGLLCKITHASNCVYLNFLYSLNLVWAVQFNTYFESVFQKLI